MAGLGNSSFVLCYMADRMGPSILMDIAYLPQSSGPSRLFLCVHQHAPKHHVHLSRPACQ
jgi:hypothetical protein